MMDILKYYGICMYELVKEDVGRTHWNAYISFISILSIYLTKNFIVHYIMSAILIRRWTVFY
jgi:hypothetical protein